MDFKQILGSYRDEVVALLRDLVSFESVNAEPEPGKPFGAGVDACYRFMLERAEADGFEVFDAEGYGGHIEWPGVKPPAEDGGEGEEGEPLPAEETLAIPVHLDTVPVGEGWIRDPLGGEEEDGYIYGRGTTDNKDAVCATYFAMKALRDAGHVPSKNVRLILGLDEETGFSGMEVYLDRTSPPDLGFVPDARFPLIMGEKGNVIFEIAKKFSTSSETGLKLSGISGGEAANMVPGSARAVLSYDDTPGSKSPARKKRKAKRPATKDSGKRAAETAFEKVKLALEAHVSRTGRKLSCQRTGSALVVSAEGASAHAANPAAGLNAVSVLMEFLGTLEFAEGGAKDFIDFYNEHIAFDSTGAKLGIAMSDSPSGPLTMNAGTIRMNKDAVLLMLDIRYPVTKTDEDIYSPVRHLLDTAGIGLVKKGNMPPLYFPEDTDFIATLLEVYRRNTGDIESRPSVIGGRTYASLFQRTVAFGPMFPGAEELMHRANERVETDALMRAAEIYADSIRELTKPE